MRPKALAIAAACIALSGCATVQYAGEFQNDAVAQFHAAGKYFRAWPHRDPRRNTILLTGGVGQAAMSGFQQGLTFGLVTGNSSYEQWSAGAHWLVDPVGCEVENLRPIDQTTTWAFEYRCPADVDLRAVLLAHRAELLQGQPLPPSRSSAPLPDRARDRRDHSYPPNG